MMDINESIKIQYIKLSAQLPIFPFYMKYSQGLWKSSSVEDSKWIWSAVLFVITLNLTFVRKSDIKYTLKYDKHLTQFCM